MDTALASRLGDVWILGGLRIGPGSMVIVAGWALIRHARRLQSGHDETTRLW